MRFHSGNLKYHPPNRRMILSNESLKYCEKGYLDDPKPFIEKIDRIETQFINILKKRYES